MEKLSQKKRAFIALSACIIILTSIKFSDHKYSSKITFNDEYILGSEEPFGTYRRGNIYIGDQEFIDRIFDESTDDVYVVDLRNLDNPNLEVCNSYEFRDRDEMMDILEVLQEYERRYPTDWDRTNPSMMNEWRVHNVLYDISFERSHTKEVDFDNLDEEIYNSKLLTKISKFDKFK